MGDVAERPLGDIERRVRGGVLGQVDADAGTGAVLGEERRGDRVDAFDAAELLGERGQLALLEGRGAGDVDVGGVGGACGEGGL